tara:strand:- start:395 stop:571 length:177 start_codon:yes stop_codon:yes gene_type:complete
MLRFYFFYEDVFSGLAIGFSVTDSFKVVFPLSDINFEADRLFRENSSTILFSKRCAFI